MNKFNIILNETTKITESIATVTDKDVVKEKISDYAGFNIDDLLLDVNNSAFIFGGAVRDSIAGQQIHDIDIITLPRAARTLSQKLVDDLGFEQIPLVNVDIISLYFGHRIINLPWTYIKDGCIVQLIRPVIGKDENPLVKMQICLSNVDLSCCGVVYAVNSLFEMCEDAIDHCKQRVFKTLFGNLFYREDRISHRKVKLFDRGWTEIK